MAVGDAVASQEVKMEVNDGIGSERGGRGDIKEERMDPLNSLASLKNRSK